MGKLKLVYSVWCSKDNPCPYCIGKDCRFALVHEPPNTEMDMHDITKEDLLYWSGESEELGAMYYD